ncbi:DUF2795 domain-containing protein [Thermopolyspora sp. NPDC052614]|uniref:DUF2795 domain-containing protein n=1 Tax=Thermopolyspora sp. NPDC052614 TaxID=3155682 RepID=UPI003422E46A
MKLRDTRPVKEALNDLDFPADKQRIVEHARRHGADEATDRALSALPLGDYAGMAEVLRSVEVDPAPDRTESERFQQRSRGRKAVAEHLRPREKTPIEEELE